MSVRFLWDRPRRERKSVTSTASRYSCRRAESAEMSHRGSRKGGRRRVLYVARLDRLIKGAIDPYNESEQRTGFQTALADHLQLPFETMVLGAPVLVERIDLNKAEEIVAICRRGRNRQALPILDLPLPTPPPSGAEWIEAYRRWATGR